MKVKELDSFVKIRQLIIHNLIEIIELNTNYTVAQHLSYLSDKTNFYEMTDVQVLKKIEDYRRKLSVDEPEELLDLMDDIVLQKYLDEKKDFEIDKEFSKIESIINHGKTEEELHFS